MGRHHELGPEHSCNECNEVCPLHPLLDAPTWTRGGPTVLSPGAPGDFENAGFLGVPNGYVKASAATKEKKLAAEIANGRLAMMAIIGRLG